MSTESSVIRVMNMTPKTSHTSAADHSADPGAFQKMASVSPQVTRVPRTTRTVRNTEWTAAGVSNRIRHRTRRGTLTVSRTTRTVRNTEWTAALAMTNAVRDTGLVSTRTAVPLLVSAEMM